MSRDFNNYYKTERKGRSQVRAITGRKLSCKKTLKHCIDTEILRSRKMATFAGFLAKYRAQISWELAN